jgi:hypothetical protein
LVAPYYYWSSCMSVWSSSEDYVIYLLWSS